MSEKKQAKQAVSEKPAVSEKKGAPKLGMVYHANLDEVVEIPGFNIRDTNANGITNILDLYPQITAAKRVTQSGRAFIMADGRLGLITAHRRFHCLLAARDVIGGVMTKQAVMQYYGIDSTMYDNTSVNMDLRLPLEIVKEESPLKRHIDNLRSNTGKTPTVDEQGRGFIYIQQTMTYADWIKETGRTLPTSPRGLTPESHVLSRDIAVLMGCSPSHVSQCSALIVTDNDSETMAQVKTTLLEAIKDENAAFNSNDARAILTLARKEDKAVIGRTWTIDQISLAIRNKDKARLKAEEDAKQAERDKQQAASDKLSAEQETGNEHAPTAKALKETEGADDDNLVGTNLGNVKPAPLPEGFTQEQKDQHQRQSNDAAILHKMLVAHGIKWVVGLVELFARENKQTLPWQAAIDQAVSDAIAIVDPVVGDSDTMQDSAPANDDTKPVAGPKPGREAAKRNTTARKSSKRKAA